MVRHEATPSGELNAELRQVAASGNTPEHVVEAGRDALAALASLDGLVGVPIGQQAPAFALPDARGNVVSLAERLVHGSVVVSFYRGAWCPYCNLELRALQQALPDIVGLGASLIAISQQGPDDSLTLTERYGLEFDVLSDLDGSVTSNWKLRFEVTERFRVVFDFFGVDLTKENADGSWTMPVPATFVLDSRGVVRDRHVSVDYTSRMEPARVLSALREVSR